MPSFVLLILCCKLHTSHAGGGESIQDHRKKVHFLFAVSKYVWRKKCTELYLDLDHFISVYQRKPIEFHSILRRPEHPVGSLHSCHDYRIDTQPLLTLGPPE